MRDDVAKAASGRAPRRGRFRDLPGSAALYGGLIAANAGAWAWAWAAFHDRPALLGIALLAWVFGLRHAVDADHIAAIDNVVRKLMQDGKRPLTVGLCFSLGHSTIVVLASLAIAATAAAMQDRLDAAKQVGGIVGTFGLGRVPAGRSHLPIWSFCAAVWRSFREVRRGGSLNEEALDLLLAGRGLLARLFRPLFRAITQSWHMYPLGFLFGLGFDTATEVGLLGIAATQAAQGMSPWQTMVFPGAVHRRHGAGGHDRQRADGRRLWLGLHQSAAQAVVQPDDHRRLGVGRAADRRHRGAWA